MSRFFFIVLFSFLSAGCWSNGQSYVDWHGVWFGCPNGQIELPAVRGMFGMVKYPSRCVTADATTRSNDYEECSGMLHSNEAIYACMARKGWKQPDYDPEGFARLHKDFAECRPLGKDGQVDAAVDACMKQRGWP